MERIKGRVYFIHFMNNDNELLLLRFFILKIFGSFNICLYFVGIFKRFPRGRKTMNFEFPQKKFF